jgi:hypothetical protein
MLSMRYELDFIHNLEEINSLKVQLNSPASIFIPESRSAVL